MAYWHAKNSPTKHSDTDAHNKKFGEGHSNTATSANGDKHPGAEKEKPTKKDFKVMEYLKEDE